MPLSSRQLIEFLEEVGKSLGERITLVGAGGTALTLYGLKPSTKDVDFTGPSKDVNLFMGAVRLVQPGFKVDIWPDGQVFNNFLPPDYLRRSRHIRKLSKIELRALAPVDLVVTKIGRLDERDSDDIKACIKGFKLRKKAITQRAEQVQFVGNEDLFNYNLKTVTTGFFGRKRSKRLEQMEEEQRQYKETKA